jgi:hypothetical protein
VPASLVAATPVTVNVPAVADIDDTPIPLDPELEDDVASENTSTGHVAEHAG